MKTPGRASRVPGGKSGGAARLRAWLLALTAGLMGCATVQLPPADLTAPGWTVQETVAVWQPRRGEPELMGELLVATHADGSRLVQFSKQGLPLVLARSGAAGWQLTSPHRKSAYSGHGTPTARVPWFQVTALPPGSPPAAPWTLVTNADGSWRLAHAGTGEMLEAAAR